MLLVSKGIGGIVGGALLLLSLVVSAAAEPLVFHATMSGKQALDRDAKGGNPFASALIDALGAPSLGVAELAATLERLTVAYSKGYQRADAPGSLAHMPERLVPAAPGEQRVALVLVVSDYAKADVESLPGARFDAERIAAALRRAGFETEVALDLDREAMTRKLAAFAEMSSSKDVAAIYTTGHGVEVDGTVYLLPGDYPVQERNRALAERALPLPRIAGSTAAKRLNLVFYGGCRDNPLAE